MMMIMVDDGQYSAFAESQYDRGQTILMDMRGYRIHGNFARRDLLQNRAREIMGHNDDLRIKETHMNSIIYFVSFLSTLSRVMIGQQLGMV
jgi:hypothetical protein